MSVRLVAEKANSIDALPRFSSITALIESVRPMLPYYALHPAKFRRAADRFIGEFPGTTMYAVKANPALPVLDQIYGSGIRHFDTASLAEIELIRGRYSDAHCHFMAPVRLPGAAAAAWREHGIRDFVVDSDQELDKLLSETDGGKGLRIFVRIATPLGGAILELSSKFGTKPEHGVKLLRRIADAGATPAITFHVGSQCLSPFTYAQAVEMSRRAAVAADVEIAALDVGGGFPNTYPGNDVPPYHWYFDTIRESLSTFPLGDGAELLCEPGRALCAEGCTLINRVILNKGDALFINDGKYGNMDELCQPGWTAEYVHKVYRLDGTGHAYEVTGAPKQFRIYGPTCDTVDVLPNPMTLPENIALNDYIVFENAGAYSASCRTRFNGLYADDWAIID
jgi:ornithine decarboxylase